VPKERLYDTFLGSLHQQVNNEKKTRVAATCRMGHASPKTKQKRVMLTVVNAYGNLLLLHNEAQHLEKNNCLKMSFLYLQNSGQSLQDTILVDPLLWDWMTCPLCHHLTTQRRKSWTTENQADRAAISAARGDG
jgi:hypothetical protein